MTRSAGTSGLIRAGSPPSAAMASRIAARSTTAGTPVKSWSSTRAGRKGTSASAGWPGRQAASVRTSCSVTVSVPAWRSTFSSRILTVIGGRVEVGQAGVLEAVDGHVAVADAQPVAGGEGIRMGRGRFIEGGPPVPARTRAGRLLTGVPASGRVVAVLRPAVSIRDGSPDDARFVRRCRPMDRPVGPAFDRPTQAMDDDAPRARRALRRRPRPRRCRPWPGIATRTRRTTPAGGRASASSARGTPGWRSASRSRRAGWPVVAVASRDAERTARVSAPGAGSRARRAPCSSSTTWTSSS